MKRLRTVVVVVLVLLPLDVGVARYCRSNCDFWQNTYPAADHRIRSEDYHHTLAPNRQVTEAWGLSRYRYATNSLGFKDSGPRDVDPKGGGYRVLFLGDSFTEGKGFAFPETFVGLVAAKLADRGIEVLNGAVDSYAPVIYQLKTKHLLEKVGLRFDVCVVFLDVSDIYDEAVRYRFDGRGRLVVPPANAETPSGGTLGFLSDNSAIARLARIVYDHVTVIAKFTWLKVKIANAWEKSFFDVDATDLWVSLVTNFKASAWTYDDARWRAYGAAGRQRAAEHMDALWSLLKARGIPLVLAVYPWPDQLFHDPRAPRHQGFWRAWSEARGVQFISLFPAFTEGEPRDVLKRYFIPYDFHWNSEGHRLVARTFLENFNPRLPSGR